MLKKIFILLILVLGGLVAFAFVGGSGLVKRGVETYGPSALGVDVNLAGVSLNPISASGGIEGFALGQPEGFGDDMMIAVGGVSFDLEAATLLSDHIIIDSLVIDSPAITSRFVGTKSNIQTFTDQLAALQGADTPNNTSASNSPGQDAASEITLTIRKLEVRSPTAVLATDGMVKTQQTLDLADFTLTDLGTDEEGLAPQEVARHVMDTLAPQIAKAYVSAGFDDLLNLSGETGSSLKDKAEGLIGGLLGGKKKKN